MATKSNKAVKISQKHLLGIQDLSINDVNLILNESQSFIKLNQSKNKRLNVLNGKTQINLFSQLDVNVSKREKNIDQNAAAFILQGAIDFLNN